MDTNTEINDHWIIDSEYTDKEDFSYSHKIMLESINAKIDANVDEYEDSSTFSDEVKEEDLFSVPKIDYLSNKGTTNYMANSQNWIGHVIKLSENEFTAKLKDLNDPTTDEIADFEIIEVSKGDFELLKLGAVFYWGVGYANQNGQIIKQSIIRFKRSVDVTVSEFDRIMKEAEDLNNSLKWE